MLSLNELERRAYIEGDVKLVSILHDLEDEIERRVDLACASYAEQAFSDGYNAAVNEHQFDGN